MVISANESLNAWCLSCSTEMDMTAPVLYVNASPPRSSARPAEIAAKPAK
jgi:hypothetical protein